MTLAAFVVLGSPLAMLLILILSDAYGLSSSSSYGDTIRELGRPPEKQASEKPASGENAHGD